MSLTETIPFNPNIVLIEDYTPEIDPVAASVFGQVIDEQDNPIADALVKLDDNTLITNEKGHFIFSKVTMNKAGTYIEVNKEGYYTGSTRYFPKENSKNYVTIRLMEKIGTGSFSAGQGGTINGANGFRIDFLPNSVVDAAGNLYNGEVVVFGRWINPESEQLEEIMPGNLQGINSQNQDVALETFGMAAVELATANGDPLNLGNGKKSNHYFSTLR